jgi:hypothetical protein
MTARPNLWAQAAASLSPGEQPPIELNDPASRTRLTTYYTLRTSCKQNAKPSYGSTRIRRARKSFSATFSQRSWSQSRNSKRLETQSYSLIPGMRVTLGRGTICPPSHGERSPEFRDDGRGTGDGVKSHCEMQNLGGAIFDEDIYHECAIHMCAVEALQSDFGVLGRDRKVL